MCEGAQLKISQSPISFTSKIWYLAILPDWSLSPPSLCPSPASPRKLKLSFCVSPIQVMLSIRQEIQMVTTSVPSQQRSFLSSQLCLFSGSKWCNFQVRPELQTSLASFASEVYLCVSDSPAFLFYLGQSSASLGVGDVLLRLSANVSRGWSVFLGMGFISCYLVILITKMPGNVEAQLHSHMNSLKQ